MHLEPNIVSHNSSSASVSLTLYLSVCLPLSVWLSVCLSVASPGNRTWTSTWYLYYIYVLIQTCNVGKRWRPIISLTNEQGRWHMVAIDSAYIYMQDSKDSKEGMAKATYWHRWEGVFGRGSCAQSKTTAVNIYGNGIAAAVNSRRRSAVALQRLSRFMISANWTVVLRNHARLCRSANRRCVNCNCSRWRADSAFETIDYELYGNLSQARI